MWLFVLFSVAGLLMEEAFHWVTCGEFQDRAGLVVGPFSPIYGVGGLCMTLAAKRMGHASVPRAFLVSALAGGLVEYIASLLLESVFGLRAWDYSDQWLSIDGRTSGCFLLIWGALGVLCTKVVVPALEGAVLPRLERIPLLAQKALAVFLVVDVALTVVSFGCWQQRQAGEPPQDPLGQVCSQVFDDDFMAARFETLSFVPEGEGSVL